MHLVLRLCLAVSLAVFGAFPQAASALNFVVDDPGSAPDDDAPADDAICQTQTNKCTLRAAIQEAIEQPGPHNITFMNTITTINLAFALDTITAPVNINGTTTNATTGGRVEINGSDLGCFSFLESNTAFNANGARGSTIQNLVIRNCSGNAISISGHGYTVSGNRIGTNGAGTASNTTTDANTGDGISLSGTIPPPAALPNIASLINNPPTNFAAIAAFAVSLRAAFALLSNPPAPNTITGNLISGNSGDGIELFTPMAVNTYILGNIIGLNQAATASLPNGHGAGNMAGIRLASGAYGNFIGPGNIVSGQNEDSTDDGINLGSGEVLLPNFVMGNLVGPGSTPVTDVGNGDVGIYVDTTPDVTGPGATNPTGYAAFIGPANTVSDNRSDNGGGSLDAVGGDNSGGIVIATGTGTRIYGNFIGLFQFPAGGTPIGSLDTGNRGNGIVVTTGGHQIGGSEAFEANLILRNARHGILIRGSATDNVLVRGNFVGVTDPTGLGIFSFGNGGDGLIISDASTVTVGGTGQFDDNVFAGNGRHGIKIQDNGSEADSGWSNLFQRNQIYANNQDAGDGITGLGIDLDFVANGVDPTDDTPAADPNTQYGNYAQNAPIICTGPGTPSALCASAPGFAGGTSTTSWTIKTRPNGTYRVEFFMLTPTSMTYMGEQAVSTDGSGLPTGAGCVAGLCTSSMSSPDTRGTSIVMTATDLFLADVPPVGTGPVSVPSNNTSEFSNAAGVPQEVAFTSATYSVSETGPTATLTLQRFGGGVGAISVNVILAAAPGTATGGGVDYTFTSPTQVNWADGDTANKTVNIAIVNDPFVEPDETVNFELDSPSGAIEGAINATTLTITNNDVAPDLGITKTHTGDFVQGQVGATYTITVSNAPGAPTDTSVVTVTDTLPAGLTATGFAGTGWTCDPLPALSCTRSDVLAASASYPTITLTVTVAGNATSPQTNTATVSGGGDATPGNNTATDPTTVVPPPQPPDLSVDKTHTGDFTQGQVGATYSITVSNSATAATSGTVTVVDTLPAGLTATALTGTGWTCVLGTLTCTRSDVLAVSSSYPAITLTVTVAGDAPVQVTNTATVSGGGDVSAGNNADSDPTTVNPPAPVANLGITKTHSGNFTQGQVGATYTITVSNDATAATAGTVTVTDTLPAGLTATALTGTNWSCVLGTLTCTRSDVLAVSASYEPITLTVTVAGNATTPQVNMAALTGGGDNTPVNNSVNDSTIIDGAPASPDLSILKTHSGNFTQGQVGATYTITVSNSAAAATSGTVTVTDTLPAGLTATGFAGTGWTCDPVPALSCTRNDVLAVSSSYEPITLTVTVAGDAAAQVTNTATVAGGGDASPGNNSDDDLTTIDPAAAVANLGIIKTHSGNFTQGQAGAIYTIIVSNDATAATAGPVTVVDALPAGLTATGLTGTGWTCTLATFSCVRSDVLPPGASYEPIVLTVTVAGNATSPQVNTVTVIGGGDNTPVNNTFNDSTIIDGAPAAPDLSILKTHSGNFTQGQVGATYTITVSNSAAAATSGTVTVVDTLPAGLTATALSGTGWTCVLGTFTCTRADVLAVSASYPPITLTVTVAGAAPAQVTNTATVSGGGDASAGNNSDDDLTTVDPAAAVANLGITKTHSGNFTQGQVGATYAITVSNDATAATAGTVTMVDTLPSGLTATALTGTGWTCTLATLSCTRSDVLAASASYPAITLTVTVAGNATSPQVNMATVSGGGDNTPVNNAANDSTIINGAPPAPDLSLDKVHAGNFTQGQVGATYTITVSNSAAAATSGTVTVVDSLPAGMTATALSGTGWTCTLGTLTCTRSDVLAVSSSYPPITLTVTVSGSAGSPLVNTATVSGGGDASPGNNSDADSATVNTLPPDLTISKTHAGNFTQGQLGVTFTITVSNVGAGPTVGTVTAIDNVPAGLTATGISGTGWTCVLATATCTRADALAPGASYPPIILTANVSGSALAVLINTVSVSGGGDLSSGNDVAADTATVFAVGGGGPAVPVPALSNWALYLLALLVLGFGLALRRRAYR